MHATGDGHELATVRAEESSKRGTGDEYMAPVPTAELPLGEPKWWGRPFRAVKERKTHPGPRPRRDHSFSAGCGIGWPVPEGRGVRRGPFKRPHNSKEAGIMSDGQQLSIGRGWQDRKSRIQTRTKGTYESRDWSKNRLGRSARTSLARGRSREVRETVFEMSRSTSRGARASFASRLQGFRLGSRTGPAHTAHVNFGAEQEDLRPSNKTHTEG